MRIPHGSRVHAARGLRCGVGVRARSAHLVWRAGDGVRGDVACRRLARLGLEIPAVRGAARGPWPRGVWGGEGGAGRVWARAAPLTTRYGPRTAGYWLLATRGSPGSPRLLLLLLLLLLRYHYHYSPGSPRLLLCEHAAGLERGDPLLVADVRHARVRVACRTSTTRYTRGEPLGRQCMP